MKSYILNGDELEETEMIERKSIYSVTALRKEKEDLERNLVVVNNLLKECE